MSESNEITGTVGEQQQNSLYFSLEGVDLADVESLGSYLKAVREQKQLAVEHVAVELNMKKEHIDAIESDTILDYVPTAYARGFCRNYAELLELDYHAVVERFNGLYKTDSPKIYVKDVGPLVALERRTRRRKGVFIYVAAGILTVAVIAAGVYGYYQIKPLFLVERDKGKQTTTPVSTKEGESGSPVTVQNDCVLEVKFIMNAAAKVTVDGTDIYGKGRIFGAGLSEKFSAQESLVVEIDEASNVEVYHKGAKISGIGTGRVRLTLDENNREKPVVESVDQQPSND